MEITVNNGGESERQSASVSEVSGEDAHTTVKLFDCYYDVEEEGHEVDEPVIYLKCRDEDDNHWFIEVEGFHPYFLVKRSELTPTVMADLDNDHRVRGFDLACDDGVEGDGLAKITVVKPYHVAELRDFFGMEATFEADVQFVDRFLIDNEIYQCIAVPADARQRRVHVDEIEAVEDDIVSDVTPRTCYFDIEVKRADSGPSVVSEKGTERATEPVTAITAYDNYDDEYESWVLAHDSWSKEQRMAVSGGQFNHEKLAGVTVFDRERELLQSFVTYVSNRQFDILTAWNAPFDVPYIVNRCLKEMDVYSILDWSPTKDVNTMNGEGRWMNSDLKGIMIFDLLEGFEKTQVHELESFSLENVAATVLDDMEKLDVNEAVAWRNDPEMFLKYSVRDVEATVQIDQQFNDGGGILA
jgi:DNA polymerase elongation subunit (family B)